MPYREKYITLERYLGEYKDQDNMYIGFVIGYGYCDTTAFAIQPAHMNGYSPSCGRLYGNDSHYVTGRQQVEYTSIEAKKLSLRGLFNNGEAVITVKSGMTLSQIAVLFDVTVAELSRWNNIDDPDKIIIGQKLTIVDKTYRTLEALQRNANRMQTELRALIFYINHDEKYEITGSNMNNEYELGPEWISYIPLIGSGRDAYVDFQDGRYGWAAFNALMAISDVFLVKSLIVAGGKIVTKTAFKTGSHNWGPTRSWMERTGQVSKGEHVHHWLLHQNQSFGKYAPKWLKNQPWNLNVFPDASSHMRFGHGKSFNKALPGNALEQVWHGTPMWPKATSGSIGGRIIEHNFNVTE